MEHKKGVISILDEYHTTATIPLEELASKITDEIAIKDLYEACKEMYQALFLADDPISQSAISKEFDKLSNALAKAEGR